MTTRPGSAPSSSKTRSWSSPTGDRTAWVVIAIPVRRAARAAARWTRSSWRRQPRLVGPDLADDPGPDPRSRRRRRSNSRTSSSARSSTVRRSIQRLGRVVGGPVPAAAHDDVQPGRLGVAPEPRRVATDPGQGQVDERPAAGRPIGLRARARPRRRRRSAPSSPSGPGRATARSRCARGAGRTRARRAGPDR